MTKEGKETYQKYFADDFIFLAQRKIQTLDVLVKKAIVFVREIWLMRGKTEGNSPFELIRIPSRFCT